MSGKVTGKGLANREGHHDFDITWPWVNKELAPGMTTVLRVKNEARSLPWVLPGLFQATNAVVLVDNGSDDGTPEVARKVAAENGADDRLTVFEYPFNVSRCGPEHLNTHEHSIHSLAYFYNWAFAQVHTTYSLKWDGDMVLTREGVATYADLAWQMRTPDTIITMPRHSLFVESDKVAYIDLGLRNIEPWVFPTGPEYTFVKAFEWELRMHPDEVKKVRLPEGLAVELKYLDSDEFDHWTDTDAFSTSVRTARKRREFEVFNQLASGKYEGLDGIVRVEAPEGQHVIDYVTREWLPRQPRPLYRPNS